MRDTGQFSGDSQSRIARVHLDAGHRYADAHHQIARVDLDPGPVAFDAHTANAGVDLDGGHMTGDTYVPRAPVDLDPGHKTPDTHHDRAGVDLDVAQTTAGNQGLGGRVDLDPGQVALDAHLSDAGVDLPTCQCATPSGEVCADCPNLDPGQARSDIQGLIAGANSCAAQTGNGTHGLAGGAPSCGDRVSSDNHERPVAATHDTLLLILADAVDDLERVRIATDNRIRSLAQVKGLDNSPETKRLTTIRDGIAALEHSAKLDLQRAMRAHPLGPWVKRTIGVGEKQAARLLAAIGDPADRPNPAKLWQYAGHGDPARSHCRKGKPVEHSPIAKMRTRLIAESCMKQMASPYRAVYDRERAKWADRDTTDLHRHNHALRVVGKAMLLDLWREARDLRGDHSNADAQPTRVPADLPPISANSTPITEASAADLRGGHDARGDHDRAAPADLRVVV